MEKQSCDSIIYTYIDNDAYALQCLSFGPLIFLCTVKLGMIREILQVRTKLHIMADKTSALLAQREKVHLPLYVF